VIVETDDGLTGYGEAKGTPVVMKVLVEDVLGPQLVGEDPTRVEFLWEKMYSASRLPLALAHGRPYHRAGSRGETIHAISGVDVALWDIYGKSLGVPIYRLLGGGVRERMRATPAVGEHHPTGPPTRSSAIEPGASRPSRSAPRCWATSSSINAWVMTRTPSRNVSRSGSASALRSSSASAMLKLSAIVWFSYRLLDHSR